MSYVQTQGKPRPIGVVEHIGSMALTSVNTLPAAPAHYVYIGDVRLWLRDMQLLEGVASFGAMTTGQIRELYFDGLKSRTSCQVVLKRLVDNGALDRVHIHLPSSSRGGSPTGCYKIGRATWNTFYPNMTYKNFRDPWKLMHTLFMVDTFVELKRMERAGVIAIKEVDVESKAWTKGLLDNPHPDLQLRLDAIARGESMRLLLEVDRSNEYEAEIQRKAERYIAALAAGAYGSDKPRVVFIVLDQMRVDTLKRYLRGIRDRPSGLFVVYTLADFVEMLGRPSS